MKVRINPVATVAMFLVLYVSVFKSGKAALNTNQISLKNPEVNHQSQIF